MKNFNKHDEMCSGHTSAGCDVRNGMTQDHGGAHQGRDEQGQADQDTVNPYLAAPGEQEYEASSSGVDPRPAPGEEVEDSVNCADGEFDRATEQCSADDEAFHRPGSTCADEGASDAGARGGVGEGEQAVQEEHETAADVEQEDLGDEAEGDSAQEEDPSPGGEAECEDEEVDPPRGRGKPRCDKIPEEAMDISCFGDDHIAVQYLYGRGFDLDEAAELRLHWWEMPVGIKRGNRLICPIIMEDESGQPVLAGWQARFLQNDGNDKPDPARNEVKWFTAPGTRKSEYLYNHALASNSPVVAVTEGPFDVLGGVGPRAGVAVLGKTISTAQSRLLWKGWGEQGALLIMGLDGDAYEPKPGKSPASNKALADGAKKLRLFEEKARRVWKGGVIRVRFSPEHDAGSTPRRVFWNEVYRLLRANGKQDQIPAIAEHVGVPEVQGPQDTTYFLPSATRDQAGDLHASGVGVRKDHPFVKEFPAHALRSSDFMEKVGGIVDAKMFDEVRESPARLLWSWVGGTWATKKLCLTREEVDAMVSCFQQEAETKGDGFEAKVAADVAELVAGAYSVMEDELDHKAAIALALDFANERTTAALLEKTPPQAYYFSKQDRYYVLSSDKKGWKPLRKDLFVDLLKDKGLKLAARAQREAGLLGVLEKYVLQVSLHDDVSYAGPLAGHKMGPFENGGERILVTQDQKFVAPVQGAWPTWRSTVEAILGEVDGLRFLRWLSQFARALVTGRRTKGLVLGVVGAVNNGKSLIIEMASMLAGGVTADAYEWISGGDKFNDEMIRKPLWVVDDKDAKQTQGARQHLAGKMKEVVANGGIFFRGICKDGITLDTLRRLIVCVNDTPERILVLPELKEDVEDKLLILKASCSQQLPMPVFNEEQRRAFREQLVREAPAFVYDAMHSPELQDEEGVDKSGRPFRFGIRPYVHPEVAEALSEVSSSGDLEAALEIGLLSPYANEWPSGMPVPAVAVYKELTHKESRVPPEMRRYIPKPQQLGRKLKELKKTAKHIRVVVSECASKDRAAFKFQRKEAVPPLFPRPAREPNEATNR